MTGGPRLKRLMSHINTATRGARTFTGLRVRCRISGCEVSRLLFIRGAVCTTGVWRKHQSLSAQPLDGSTHMLAGGLHTPPAHPHMWIHSSSNWFWQLTGFSENIWQIFSVWIDIIVIWVKNTHKSEEGLFYVEQEGGYWGCCSTPWWH